MAEPACGSIPVGVVGASARAAIQSLARAGLSGWAVDLFADRDLKLLAPCATCPVGSFPEAIPELAARFPPGPLLYTGGLENHPEVVEHLASSRPLYGNPPHVLHRVRDPYFLASVFDGLLPFLALVPTLEPAPAVGRWLRKPLRSSAGHGIRFAKPGEGPNPQHYFQEYVEGRSLSAQFVSSLSGTELLGITEQLIGEPWLHARPFAYCGNLGPFVLPEQQENQLKAAAVRLTRETGLRGLWGLDFLLRGEALHPLEVNPRYTAAVEVLELSTGRSYMTHHCDCFRDRCEPTQPARAHGPRCVGKAIYYAPSSLVFPQSGPWDADLSPTFDPGRMPWFADIPEPGVRVEAGSPVFTVFVDGPTAGACRKRLQSQAEELDRHFQDNS